MAPPQCFFCLFRLSRRECLHLSVSLFPLSRRECLHLSVSFVCFFQGHMSGSTSVFLLSVSSFDHFLHLTSSLGVCVGRDGGGGGVNPTLHQTVNRRSATPYINSTHFQVKSKDFLVSEVLFFVSTMG